MTRRCPRNVRTQHAASEGWLVTNEAKELLMNNTDVNAGEA